MYYKQPIILFGFVVPLIICAAVVGGAFALKSKASATFEAKRTQFKTHQINSVSAKNLEKEISIKREHTERWMVQLEKESASELSGHLRQISEILPSKEFQLTASERSNAKTGFGSASAQKSAQFKLAFRGTFRSLQRAFLELETRMPNLQLDDLKIDPGTNSPNTLNASVSYTAWEK